LLLCSLLSYFIPMIEVPIPDYTEAVVEIPERLAKLVKKELPKPPPMLASVTKQPEEEPKELQEKPKEKPKEEPKEKLKTEEPKKTQEKPKNENKSQPKQENKTPKEAGGVSGVWRSKTLLLI
jgi:protein TonB